MNFKTKNIYLKAKELRELTMEAVDSSPYEDAHLREKLLKLSLQIPFQIGLSLNLYSLEDKQLYLRKAKKNLSRIQIAIDLSTSEFLRIDSPKFDSLMEEISELLQITLEQAEEDEKKRIDEIMKEFMVSEENSTN